MEDKLEKPSMCVKTKKRKTGCFKIKHHRDKDKLYHKYPNLTFFNNQNKNFDYFVVKNKVKTQDFYSYVIKITVIKNGATAE